LFVTESFIEFIIFSALDAMFTVLLIQLLCNFIN